MSILKTFKIDVCQRDLNFIYKKVSEYPWHEMPSDGGWQFGANIDFMKDLCKYWVKQFDWKRQEDKINLFDNFTAEVDGIEVHFIYERGSGSKPKPLIISHGWPGSIIEFIEIIDPLAHPERYGGNAEDAFDVIVPSLVGFGFSGKPPRPYGPRRMALIFNKLMTEVLGYKSYIAQGGDWGGTISTWLGYDYPKFCEGIHINIMTVRHYEGPKGVEEELWASTFEEDQIPENGYRILQATKPQTLSYGMMDSPVGIAAWIIEKFYSWSDNKRGDIETVFSKDVLLTNIMIYIITKTFNTASWIYYGREEEGGRVLSKKGKRVEVPTACALFPAEMSSWPPRSYVDRVYNVRQWTEMPSGGHFAAMEQPKFLIEDLRNFVRSLK
ncbi:MAG: epoxide hydrolase family protein [Paracoccaceae bacterium]|tara:strand:- start:5531 stop:6679 length:1149 start_codon:yes stop_codon:yes gene_type:complete